MKLAHKVYLLEQDPSKAIQESDLEKDNNFLRKYLEEERRLKEGAIEKYQFSMEKASEKTRESIAAQ